MTPDLDLIKQAEQGPGGSATRKVTAPHTPTPRSPASSAGRRPKWGVAAQLHRRGDPHRLLFASINEACKILEEGKAYRASGIDVMWLNSFGFPRYRGGLMYWPTASALPRSSGRSPLGTSGTANAGAAPLLCLLAETGTPFREAKPGRAMSAALEGSAADRSRCPAGSPRQAGSTGYVHGSYEKLMQG